MARNWDIWFGLVGLLFGLFALLVWLPNDIRGGFTELSLTGKPRPGDAFYPMLLAGFIATMSCLQIALSLLRRPAGPATATLTSANLRFLAIFLCIVLIGLAVMRHAGPAWLWLTDDPRPYRLLIDTAPYKYLGFAAGGFGLTVSLIAWAEGRFSLRAALVSAVLILLLIAIFDLGLSNIQLPPNAEA